MDDIKSKPPGARTPGRRVLDLGLIEVNSYPHYITNHFVLQPCRVRFQPGTSYLSTNSPADQREVVKDDAIE